MNLDLARVQFATTSIYHFLFVPVTMGLALWWPSCRRSGTAPATPSSVG